MVIETMKLCGDDSITTGGGLLATFQWLLMTSKKVKVKEHKV